MTQSTLQSGLVSITFRQLSPQDIIALVREASLDAIEWGGDIHVPHGDLDKARSVGQLTTEAGLRVAAYGSYYRVAASEQDGLSFESVLATAAALGAPLIRVWAGNKRSSEADEAHWQLVIDDLKRIAELASDVHITVALEFHSGTLTDTPETAHRLLTEVSHPNLKTLWQPNGHDWPNTTEERIAGLTLLLPWLTNVHVFNWTSGTRHSLIGGAEDWNAYLDVIASSGQSHTALLEFVPDDSINAFLEDAKTLRRWLASDF